MRLTELRLERFRNLVSASLDVPSEGAILVGDNAQGKTNFLEAIHYLTAFRSFRNSRHADAIAFGADHFRVEGLVEYGNGRRRTIAVAADRSTRRISIDGAEAKTISEASGAVSTVILSPEDHDLLAGGPSERRDYLDGILARTSGSYERALREYDRTLRQRNELLRASPRSAAPVLPSWNAALVERAVPIVRARAGLVDRLADRFDRIAAAIAAEDGHGGYAIGYRSSPPLAPGEAHDAAAVADAFEEALEESLPRDRKRGWTTVGPHRDDLAVDRGGRSIGRFGSQGERRTAAIALRLLEIEVVEADTGHRPILLLDDVFAELDRARANRLLARLGGEHQRFVTSPRPLPWLEGALPRWSVSGGRIGAVT
ncbi:MAG: DNA replication and repair protein RecF [Gemmatimonadota bacterium]|nr:DNA replication and repair protein RecF [Gemmatimonadota bacterium]